MTRRILCVGRKVGDGWELAHAGTHPLPPAALKELERLWPKMEPADMTPEECERWFAAKFENKERVTK